MSVWILQCLCPERHCVLATAYEANAEEATRLEAEMSTVLAAEISDLIDKHVLNPWCGICKAGRSTWKVEAKDSGVPTLAEAMPYLKRCEAEQQATAAYLKASKG